MPRMSTAARSVPAKYKLGDVAASEQLIQDLYLDLRRRTRQWASITMQTAQARMGYIGQHLVSVASGRPGGRSGARGHDLLHADGTPGEIKTCYRVDQLGKCRDCDGGLAPDEQACSSCGSTNLKRKDDSKWLISLRNETEYAELLTPSMYYLVLFEFTDLAKPDTIRASIWTVKPTTPGFILCMIDYYQNIRAASASKAPFNLWPYSLKFELMQPELIYRSVIKADDTINTVVFPGRDKAAPHPFSDLSVHARTKVPEAVWRSVALRFKGPRTGNRKSDMAFLEQIRSSGKVTNDELCNLIAQELYRPLVESHVGSLPKQLKQTVQLALK
jgi:hypothetical protein